MTDDEIAEQEWAEALFDVAKTALKIAAAAPLKPNQFAQDSLIPWPLIHELRSRLARAGIDWAGMKGHL